VSEERYGRNYRTYVGVSTRWDFGAANQFALLTHALRMVETDYLLDVGCGSLRAGRLFMMYLKPDRYYGLEPHRWLVEEAIANEVGQGLVDMKRPTFRYRGDLRLGAFGRPFDFILAQSIFSHAAPWQVKRCLAEAKRVLRKRFVFTYFAGDTDNESESWTYPDAVCYRPETMRGWCRQAGFRVREIAWPHPDGQVWMEARH